MSFQKQYPIDGGYYIQVSRQQGPDGVWDPNITIQLCVLSTGMELAQARLRSLEPLSYSGFSAVDFVQHSLKSVEPGKGHAHRMHDFLIDHRDKFPFELRHVYSTNPGVDNLYFVLPNQPRLYFSESAVRFWNNRIKQNKAEYSDVIKRYRIKWHS
jgi:hypothetical protein